MASFYKPLGFFFVGLAALGVFLPLLPTTPFLIIAAGCFAKSSEKWHRWLLSNRIFGPVIENWQQNKCISAVTKVISLSCIILFGGYAVVFALSDRVLRLLGGIVILGSLLLVWRLKVCGRQQS